MPKVSCVIPVYNERARISNVLNVVCGHPLVDEVVVVDDGSAESIADIVGRFQKARLVVHEKNQGKTKAILTGLASTSGEILFFLDADLEGLVPEDLTGLIEPVVSGKADMSISRRKNSPWIGIDILSGDRVFRRQLVAGRMDEIGRLARFGLEVYLNRLAIKNKLRLNIVYWKNVVSPWKYQKSGWAAGIRGDWGMLIDILKTVSIFEIIYQYAEMRALSVKN